MSFKFVDITKVIENITSRNSIMRKIMLSYYAPIVKKEVLLANVKSSDHVLCIGGGYLPCTAILFHKLSKAKVTVIDVDKDAITSAKVIINQLQLEDKVIVKHADGIDIASEHFDVIHIAMQITPKEEVFKKIHASMSSHAKILVRTPKEHLERGYQPFKHICEQHASVKQPSFSNIGITSLYVRT